VATFQLKIINKTITWDGGGGGGGGRKNQKVFVG